jgi:3'-phosphoadenosine 5'-phosphosulfate sulfotransferase (PAPS reductase)/FAD synthetase
VSEQISFLPREHPDLLVRQAKDAHAPIATVCLFSGGHDSTVLAHRCSEHYDSLAFIDTGTAVPGVREFVVEFAEWINKPLRVLESGDAYREMVLNPDFGFPGPGQHGRAYTRLKERQLERLLRELKADAPRTARVLYLSGVRRHESQRRAKRQPITRRFSAVFCNPLIDWTNEEMRSYREHYAIPESPVAALLHKSGECNCGAYSRSNPGEREELQALWPEWFERTIAALELEAEALGVKNCRWGGPDGEAEPGGDLCSSCQLAFEVAA